jgi:hypothetical protein
VPSHAQTPSAATSTGTPGGNIVLTAPLPAAPPIGSPPLPNGPPAPDAPASPSAEAIATPTEPMPEPRVTYSRRYNMAILGFATLVATWGADRLLTQGFNSPYADPPWVPIVGPWFLLAGQTSNAAPNRFTMTLLVFDGVLQASGLTLGILGLVLHKKRMTVSLPANPPR